MARRLPGGRLMWAVAIAVVLVAILAGWLFTSPRPERAGGFGLRPPSPGEVVYASLGFRFPSRLRRLVTLESVRFEDATGHYLHEDAWVYPGLGGGVGASDIADNYYFYSDLRKPRGYRLTEPEFSVMLMLQGAETPPGDSWDSFRPPGAYSVTLGLRLAGRPYTHRVQWPGPFARAGRDGRITLLFAASLAMAGAWLFLAPAPRLIGSSTPAALQEEGRTAGASFETWFANPLRYLVTLEWVHFVDPSGRYRQEEAWVHTPPAGGSGLTRDVEGSRRLAPGGLQLARRSLRIKLRLRDAATAPGGTAEAPGPYHVTLGLSFAGRPYTHRLEWPSRD